MAKALVVSGLVGGLVVATLAGAAAQEAASPDSCTGFMCKVFGSRLDDRPAPAAPTAAQAVAAIPDPADPAAAGTTSRGRVANKPAAKPLPTVTVAAGESEASRLKALASTIPGTRVRIVKRDAAAAADFTAAPVLDGPAPGEKARLFTEPLHVIAGRDVQALADLRDKVVSFGPDGGPAQTAARKAFAAAGVSVKETPLDFDNALDGMATGDVAAVVVLAPQPDARLARLKPSTAALHLVPWPDAAPVPEGAVAVAISATTYPALAPAGVRAVGVAVALDATSKGAASPAAKTFLAKLAEHSAALTKRGFDLVRADLADRAGRRVASVERR